MMKKLVLSLGLTCSLITGAFASNIDLGKLNTQIFDLLEPLQNSATTANAEFGVLNIDDENINQLNLKGYYQKLGSNNEFELKVDKLNYYYGVEESPTLNLKGSVNFDLSKTKYSEKLGTFISEVMGFTLMEMGAYIHELGNGLTIRHSALSTSRDEDGNFAKLNVLISASVDLDQIPEYMVRRLIVTNGIVSFTLDIKKGMDFDASFILNTDYYNFEENQEKVREKLEKFVEGDEETLMVIQEGLTIFDMFITSQVEEGDLYTALNLGQYFSKK